MKFFKKSLLIVCSLFLLSGCGIWDIVPLNLRFVVTNEKGENLLDENIEGNILGQTIKATFRGTEYILKKPGDISTKYYMPTFDGFVVEEGINGAEALFGELDGTENIIDEDFVIDWGDGRQDTVNINYKFKMLFGRPHIKMKFSHNGISQESSTITIVH